MVGPAWVKEFPGAVTVCDPGGIIIAMNDKSCEVFAKDGGKDLIGKNLLDCHPGGARTKLEEMLQNSTPNCYTIEKKGVKKLIYQSPWRENGEYKGFVELILELPPEVPNYLRK